jgi:hypothetical protein
MNQARGGSRGMLPRQSVLRGGVMQRRRGWNTGPATRPETPPATERNRKSLRLASPWPQLCLNCCLQPLQQ